MIVVQTIRISTAASGKFRIQNRIDVKITFATRLMAKGNVTSQGSFFLSDCTNTNPKLTRMIG